MPALFPDLDKGVGSKVTSGAQIVGIEDYFKDDVPKQPPIGFENIVVDKDFELGKDWVLEVRRPQGIQSSSPESAHDSVRPFLQAALIHRTHRANLFFQKDEVVGLRDMVWFLFGRRAVKEFGFPQFSSSKDLVSFVVEQSNKGFGQASISKARAELDHRGYTLLDGFLDFKDFKAEIEANQDSPWHKCPQLFRDIGLENWFNFVYETFPGEAYLKDEANRILWNPIVNTGYTRRDKGDRDEGKTRYMGTERLLTTHLERNSNGIKYAQYRAALEVLLGWLGGLLGLDLDFEELSSIAKSRPLITGIGCAPQCGHKDFTVVQGKSPGFFYIVTGSEGGRMQVCPGSHKFVFYHSSRLRQLANILQMEEITLPPYSVFAGHGYLQHGGAGWRGELDDSGNVKYGHELRFHTYVVPHDHYLPDIIAFGYGWSLSAGTGQEPLSGVQGNLRISRGAGDMDDADDAMEIVDDNDPMDDPDFVDDPDNNLVHGMIPEDD